MIDDLERQKVKNEISPVLSGAAMPEMPGGGNFSAQSLRDLALEMASHLASEMLTSQPGKGAPAPGLHVEQLSSPGNPAQGTVALVLRFQGQLCVFACNQKFLEHLRAFSCFPWGLTMSRSGRRVSLEPGTSPTWKELGI